MSGSRRARGLGRLSSVLAEEGAAWGGCGAEEGPGENGGGGISGWRRGSSRRGAICLGSPADPVVGVGGPARANWGALPHLEPRNPPFTAGPIASTRDRGASPPTITSPADRPHSSAKPLRPDGGLLSAPKTPSTPAKGLSARERRAKPISRALPPHGSSANTPERPLGSLDLGTALPREHLAPPPFPNALPRGLFVPPISPMPSRGDVLPHRLSETPSREDISPHRWSHWPSQRDILPHPFSERPSRRGILPRRYSKTPSREDVPALAASQKPSREHLPAPRLPKSPLESTSRRSGFRKALPRGLRENSTSGNRPPESASGPT